MTTQPITTAARSGRFACMLLAFALSLTACTRPPNDSPSKDPFEKINRPIYMFNAGLDTVIVRPVAVGYQFVTPRFFRVGVRNFFDNLTYPVTIINSFLQGKLAKGASDTGRFVLNSTLGLGGVLDPATIVGLNQHDEDFGQTLSVWGLPQGPYLVLPLLGPSTVTSSIGTLADTQMNPLMQWPNSSVRSKLFIGWTIESRQSLLSVDAAIRNAFDPYLFIREAYLQNRRFLINDGKLPEGGFENDGADFEDFDFDEPAPAETPAASPLAQ